MGGSVSSTFVIWGICLLKSWFFVNYELVCSVLMNYICLDCQGWNEKNLQWKCIHKYNASFQRSQALKPMQAQLFSVGVVTLGWLLKAEGVQEILLTPEHVWNQEKCCRHLSCLISSPWSSLVAGMEQMENTPVLREQNCAQAEKDLVHLVPTRFICCHAAAGKSIYLLTKVGSHISKSKETFHVWLWDAWKSQCICEKLEVRQNESDSNGNSLGQPRIGELWNKHLNNILEEGLVSLLPSFQGESLKDEKVRLVTLSRPRKEFWGTGLPYSTADVEDMKTRAQCTYLNLQMIYQK